MRRCWLLSVLVALPAQAVMPLDKEALRKTTPADLAPQFEQLVLPNGLTVLLSPDAASPGVVVDLSFFAGALFEPPGKSGLAHLVEHLLSAGRTPDTDYQAMLEARGATDFNASTSASLMTFHVLVPPEELPLALWVSADRLATLPPTLDDAEVERNRRIVMEERALRVDDVAFQGASQELYRTMFPAPHPLHGMVLGVPAELATVTAADARAFAARCLVPANGVLTLAGRFDQATARAWALETLGQLPGGARLAPPAAPPPAAPRVLSLSEPRSRRPRVTFAWRFGELDPDTADTLEFGALLLMIYTDGALGMDVQAGFERYLGGAVFRFDVTMANEESKSAARDNAEALLRYLTRAAAADDVFSATLLAYDRGLMAALDNPLARAAMLTRLQAFVGEPAAMRGFNGRHWSLLPWGIPPVARQALDQGRFTLHSRPLNPRPRRRPRE